MAFAHRRNVDVSMGECEALGLYTEWGCHNRVKTGWTRTDTGMQLPAYRTAAMMEGRPSLRVYSAPSTIGGLDTQKGGLHTWPSQDPYPRLGVSGGQSCHTPSPPSGPASLYSRRLPSPG